MDIAEIVRDLIAKNKLDKAINELETWATDHEQQDILQRLSIHRQKLTQIKRNVNIGALSFSEELRENAILANAILALLDEVISLIQANIKAPNNKPEPNPRTVTIRPQTSDTITILFLASNPSDTAYLQLEKEHAAITYKMQDYQQYRIVSQWATTPDTLQEAILRYKPAFIHFSGHGTGPDGEEGSRALAPRANAESTGILLEDRNGGTRIVSGTLLDEMFSIFMEIFAIEIIVLNACYSEAQASIIAQRVPYVIGMSDSVLDTAAIDFSSKFYRNLGAGLNVEQAFRLAKNNVGMNEFDNKILVLYKDGVRLH